MIGLLFVDYHPIMRQGLQQALAEEPDIDIVGEAGDGGRATRGAWHCMNHAADGKSCRLRADLLRHNDLKPL